MRKVEQQSTHADERGANGPSPIAPSQHGEREVSAALGDTSLRRNEQGLALVGDGMVLRGDFSQLLPRIRKGRLSSELLVRAAKVRDCAEPWAIDATAGLGEDSFLLAAAGFRVSMYESDPTVAALARDALDRAQANPDLADIACRMELFEEDSVEAMSHLGDTPDVIYLDPMFPERRKSAAVKKKFQLIHHLEAPCQNEGALLAAAISAGPRKVVVKRPAKGPHLAGVKPSHSLAGKAVRYDVIIPASIKVPLA